MNAASRVSKARTMIGMGVFSWALCVTGVAHTAPVTVPVAAPVAAPVTASVAAVAGAPATAAAALPRSAQSTIATPAGEPDLRFFRFDIDQDVVGAPDVAARLPGAALGAGDRIVRDGAHFRRIGTGNAQAPNGTRLRVYGINLSFAANFPTAEQAPVVARRLRALGFNAVRLHHLDTKPGAVTPLDSILTSGPFPSLNAEAVDRLRGFIGALAQQGIYVNLNIRVGYPFRPGIDDVPPLPPSGETAPLHIFHPRMRQLQADYARTLIHALGLNQHPALAMVEINNESSLLYSHEKGRLLAALTPAYRRALMDLWRIWYRQREPQASDAFADQQFAFTQAVQADSFTAFLRDIDRAYLQAMREVVQEAAGWPVPVTGTQMMYGGMDYVQSHADMDYLDEHFYIDHFDFPRTDWSRTDWRILNNDLTREEMQKLAMAYGRRDPGRPWTLSEYNMAYPNQQGAAIMPVIAAMALGGDWDALYFFDYADGKVWNQAADSFTLSGDPAKLALTGQAAHLYRAGRPEWVGPDWAFKNGQSNDVFALNTPVAAALIGRQDKGKTYVAGALRVALAPESRGYATTLISTLDEQPLDRSRHLLLTHVAGTRGTEPGSQPLRPKAMVRDGRFTLLAPDEGGAAGPAGPRDATGPMWLELVPATVQLGLDPAVTTWRVYPLDGTGRRLDALPAQASSWHDGTLAVAVHQAGGMPSAWYEIIADPAAPPP